MLEGSSVYDNEVSELISQLKAKGVLLIVIDGAKNHSPIEFASALTLEILPRVVEVLDAVSAEMKRDLADIAAGAKPFEQ